MKNIKLNYVIILVSCLCLLTLSTTASVDETRSGSTPVRFLQNKGQWTSDILYQGMSTSHNVYLLKDGLSFALTGDEKKNETGREVHPFVVWNLKFVDPNLNLNIKGDEGKESVYSYLAGNDPEKWVIHPMEYTKVLYNNIYEKVDLNFYGNGQQLEYDYILHPGSNINKIKAYYEGVKSLVVNKDGDLEVSTELGIQIQKAPVAWQIINEIKYPVHMDYTLLNDSTFGFIARAGYDKRYDLVIDPLFQMVWASYTNILGGSNNINYCFSNAMDNVGNVYLTGMVDNSFPITPGAYSGPGNVQPEIFVAKFASDGTTLLYWTYLPGSSSEFGVGIAVDEFGRAYVTGVVDLNITGLTNFPSTANAYQPVHSSGSDAFLTVLNPTGTGLVYSSFLGGTGGETGYAVAVGGSGTAYVTGHTSIGNFPVKASWPFPTGDKDIFVAKFDINQIGNSSLIYSVRIGAGPFSYCHGRSIAVNSAGNAFVTGSIYHTSGNPAFPTTVGAYNTVYNSGQDGVMSFVAKLSATTPVSLSYSTYLGPGTGNAIAVDNSTGEAFVAGSTRTFSYPVTIGALQGVHGQDVSGNPNNDAFLTKINATGSALIYSTFLGGPQEDNGTGLAINSAGEAYVTGIAQDLFPTSMGSIQPNNAGTYDFFVVNVNASGTGHGCGGATYVGGSDADYTGSFYDYPAPKLSIRDHGGINDTISVSATSHSQDFPTTPGSYGPVKVNGISDQPVFFKLTCYTASVIPSSSFSSSDSTFCNKKAVDFFDMSTNNPTSWHWYFPGAIPDTSTQQNPIGIFYPVGGSFDVTLVACNASGCDSVTFPTFITEYNPPAAPTIIVHGDTLCVGAFAGYEWYEISSPGVILSTSSCFVPTLEGTYYVQVMDSNGCKAFSIPILTSIEKYASQRMLVKTGPNPFRDKTMLEINLNEMSDLGIVVVDNLGREVISLRREMIQPGNNKVELDLSAISNGIYICTIKANRNLQTIKLIKN